MKNDLCNIHADPDLILLSAHFWNIAWCEFMGFHCWPPVSLSVGLFVCLLASSEKRFKSFFDFLHAPRGL